MDSFLVFWMNLDRTLSQMLQLLTHISFSFSTSSVVSKVSYSLLDRATSRALELPNKQTPSRMHRVYMVTRQC